MRSRTERRLRELVKAGKTDAEMAAILGWKRGSVSVKRRQYGLPCNPAHKLDPRVVVLVQRGLATREIAAELGWPIRKATHRVWWVRHRLQETTVYVPPAVRPFMYEAVDVETGVCRCCERRFGNRAWRFAEEPTKLFCSEICIRYAYARGWVVAPAALRLVEQKKAA